MDLTHFLSLYFEVNLALLVSFGITVCFKKYSPNAMSAGALLKLHYGLLLLSILTPVLISGLPDAEILRPSAQVWSSSGMKTYSGAFSGNQSVTLSVPFIEDTRHISLKAFGMSLVAVILLGAVLQALLLARDVFRLRNSISQSFEVRRLYGVRVLANDSIRVPFSFWFPFRAYVLVPIDLWDKSQDLHIAISHELQHHRQRDTVWAYFIEGIRILFFWNPAIHAWARHMVKFQELACDEALVHQGRVCPKAYGRCLLEVARSALSSRTYHLMTSGMAGGHSAPFLKRRVEMILSKTSVRTRTRTSTSTKTSIISRLTNLSLVLVPLVLLVSACVATKGVIKDQRITMEEAKKLATKTLKETTFPLVVDELVLKHLNLYLSTPDGRRSMKEALERMKKYEKHIDRVLRAYKLPDVLKAIPLVESRYQNLGPSKNSMRSAGIWQFIPGTARRYGLVVGKGRDDRLNPKLETVAAAKYLKKLHLLFQDWGLAVASYNAGENRVRKVLGKSGIRNAWELARKGELNPYIANVSAAILILRNPDILG